MRHLKIVSPLVLLVLGACSFGATPAPDPEGEGRVSGDRLISGPGEPEMDPEARVNNLLQNAKAEYDDRHFEAAHRYAEQAERIEREKLRGDKYRPMAINIQAYSLLQLGLVDDYTPASQPGVVKGAKTKFDLVLELKPRDFRAMLGSALCLFRRHGYNISKSEKLGEGVLVLSQVQALVDGGLSGKHTRDKSIEMLNEAAEAVKVFINGRARLLEMNEVFTDPMDVSTDARTGRRKAAPWLGLLDADKEELAVNDVRWMIDDARRGASLPDDDNASLRKQLGDVKASWQAVRAYWRKSALVDLQAARDSFLELREPRKGELSAYFWIDRDLAFVFTSLGGFFMDYCMDELNEAGLAAGKKIADLGKYAMKAYVDKDYKSTAKDESRKNYLAAQSYYESFIQRHEEFEKSRMGKADSTNFDDVTANPFLVDLVSRYKSEMFEAVHEERMLRKSMLLQLCALVVDPMYQVNDLDKAKVYASQLKGMDPRNPIHHFVRATACYEKGEWEEALGEYDAYLKVSSIVEDANLRKHVRDRMDLCRRNLSTKSSGASGN
ncbi:MAG: hypothetical protein IT462_17050 [Planctomycetes bacterium]|nr:hypothetical protein [Planctomycetota bacterium]